jgi:hypothetical protein
MRTKNENLYSYSTIGYVIQYILDPAKKQKIDKSFQNIRVCNHHYSIMPNSFTECVFYNLSFLSDSQQIAIIVAIKSNM